MTLVLIKRCHGDDSCWVIAIAYVACVLFQRPSDCFGPVDSFWIILGDEAINVLGSAEAGRMDRSEIRYTGSVQGVLGGPCDDITPEKFCYFIE